MSWKVVHGKDAHLCFWSGIDGGVCLLMVETNFSKFHSKWFLRFQHRLQFLNSVRKAVICHEGVNTK